MFFFSEAPAEFKSKLNEKIVKEDDSVEFECEVSKPQVKVKWSLNGERLVENENIKLTADGNKRILKIRKCALSDNGTVSCILPGDNFTSANLIVEGKISFIQNNFR